MRTLSSSLFVGSAMALLLLACSKNGEQAGPVAAPDRGRATGSQTADQGHCDYKGRQDREAIETPSTNSLLPNIRRVYQLASFAEERRRILVCREVDTNLDGIKDVIRTYNDKGEVSQEEADSDFDGKIDTWLSFTSGRLSKEVRDTNKDGNPDVWKYFVIDEEPDASREKLAAAPLKLQRIQRDTNKDGKPDVWEFYEKGHLERIGIDLDFDGRVDRWDHDAIARRERADEIARKERAAMPGVASSASGAPATSSSAPPAKP